jgi:hypothetical protein
LSSSISQCNCLQIILSVSALVSKTLANSFCNLKRSAVSFFQFQQSTPKKIAEPIIKVKDPATISSIQVIELGFFGKNLTRKLSTLKEYEIINAKITSARITIKSLKELFFIFWAP